MEYLNFILSLFGALAWIPIIGSAITNHYRRISIVPLDVEVLTNAEGVPAFSNEKKCGTILMLVLNVFIKNTTIFAKQISLTVILNNGTRLKTELMDSASLTRNNPDGSKSIFMFPNGWEFNVFRTIHADSDNLKFVSFLVENANFSTINDVGRLEFVIKYGLLFSKKVTVCRNDFPRFNSTWLLSTYEQRK